MAQFDGDIVHESVLVSEILELLNPGGEDCVFVDATLGEGGHSRVLLETFPGITVLAVERDENILAVAKERLREFSGRVHFFNEWFTDFFKFYETFHDVRPGRVLFDLGISKYHYKKSKRGFSFVDEEPLDMRLDKGRGPSAGDIVNDYDRRELAGVFREFGEEKFAWRIAGRIIEERTRGVIRTAKQLALIIESAVPAKNRRESRIHPATRCFQALRIVVNRELENLTEVLESSFRVLNTGGRMGVISYHSLEDRLVKRFFREKNKVCICPPEWPVCKCRGRSELEILTKKPVYPTGEESSRNRAARSARLRVGRKL